MVFHSQYTLKIGVQIGTTLIVFLGNKASRSSIALMSLLMQASVFVLHHKRATAADASVHVVPLSHLLSVPYLLSILIVFLRLVHFAHGVSLSWVLRI